MTTGKGQRSFGLPLKNGVPLHREPFGDILEQRGPILIDDANLRRITEKLVKRVAG